MGAVMSIDAQEFGRLQSDVEHLSETVALLVASNKGLAEKLDKVQTTLSEARGGWRVLMWVSGASATVAAALTWIATHITFRG